MYVIILCTALLSTTTAIVHNNQHQNSTYRSLRAHRVVAAWDEAQEICRSEGGYLASPISADLLDDMQYLIDANRHYNTYLIGTRAKQVPGQYVSVEGITLEDMPVLHMLERLDPHQGDCLSMDEHTISVVPCWTPMPFMCRWDNTILNNTMLKDTILNDTIMNDTMLNNTILNDTMLNNTILNDMIMNDTMLNNMILNDTMLNKTLTNSTTHLSCTEGYQYAPSTGQCYKYHEDERTWDEAEETCVAEGGHLVVINDAQEAETIHELYHPRNHHVFIGLRDRSDRNGGNYDWRSIDGIPVEQLYNVWDSIYSRQPLGLDHNCGYFRTDGTLMSYVCYLMDPFVCEKHPEQIIL